LIAIQWHSGGGKIACTGQFGQIWNGTWRRRESIDSFAAAIALLSRTSPPKSAAGFFFVFSRTRAFLFLVKKIFGRHENKISNKVHFFLVDFETDF
jgi:hypothetical protein